jgi:hypothetical protein
MFHIPISFPIIIAEYQARAGGPTSLPEREASDADAGVGRAPAPMPSHALRRERRARRGLRIRYRSSSAHDNPISCTAYQDREGGPALPQEQDDGDGDADADPAHGPAPPPRRQASRGRPVAVDDHHVIDLTLDSDPEARPRVRNPRSASPPRRRAHLLPAGLQPPAGEPMSMHEFCERYRIDPHVRDVLVEACRGWVGAQPHPRASPAPRASEAQSQRRRGCAAPERG